jgi:hypothetical protein
MRRTLIALAVAVALPAAAPAHAAEVVGRIVNIGGQAAADERVQLRELKSGKLVSEIYSDQAGIYRIDNVKAGSYTINVRSQTGVVYVGEDGVTIDWGLAPNAPPVAVATRGVTANLRGKAPGTPPGRATDTRAGAEP